MFNFSSELLSFAPSPFNKDIANRSAADSEFQSSLQLTKVHRDPKCWCGQQLVRDSSERFPPLQSSLAKVESSTSWFGSRMNLRAVHRVSDFFPRISAIIASTVAFCSAESPLVAMCRSGDFSNTNPQLEEVVRKP